VCITAMHGRGTDEMAQSRGLSRAYGPGKQGLCSFSAEGPSRPGITPRGEAVPIEADRGFRLRRFEVAIAGNIQGNLSARTSVLAIPRIPSYPFTLDTNVMAGRHPARNNDGRPTRASPYLDSTPAKRLMWPRHPGRRRGT